jgi:hypothetical protein
MEAMRDAWTDERLDDLNHRVGEGFGRADREFQALRLEMRTDFAAVRSEMAAMNRTFMQIGAGVVVTMAVGFAGTIATQL